MSSILIRVNNNLILPIFSEKLIKEICEKSNVEYKNYSTVYNDFKPRVYKRRFDNDGLGDIDNFSFDFVKFTSLIIYSI